MGLIYTDMIRYKIAFKIWYKTGTLTFKTNRMKNTIKMTLSYLLQQLSMESFYVSYL